MTSFDCMRAMNPLERKRAGTVFAKEMEAFFGDEPDSPRWPVLPSNASFKDLVRKYESLPALSSDGRREFIPVASSRYLNLIIDRVIFNKPATIVYWRDGTKTVVKCQPGDTFSKETGLALAFMKRALGNKGNFNDVFRKWVYDDEKH